jgi:hypothetical protein
VFVATCPDLLLYGALVEAETYLMNDPRIPVWANMYQNGLAALNSADDASEHSGVPLAMKLTAR